MRGADETSGSRFNFVDIEARIPARHPLRQIQRVVNDALASLSQKHRKKIEEPFGWGKTAGGPKALPVQG